MKLRLLIIALAVALLVIGSALLQAQAPNYEALRTEGERLYGEHSYALAHDSYAQAQKLQLTPEQARWVRFRLADTLWRAQAGSETPDNTKFDQARKDLESIVTTAQRDVDRDQVWAEANESLGDFYWDRKNGGRDWNTAWRYYQPALDWWAASSELDTARDRYLHIVWTASRPAWADEWYYSNYYGYSNIPQDVFENAVKIAVTPQDKAHAHFLLAMLLSRRGGDIAQQRRIPGEFEAALEGGKANEWYDDALFNYASWMEQQGPMERMLEAQQAVRVARQPAQWQHKPDYVKALALYRRLLGEFKQGETRYYDQARSRVDDITGVRVQVSVSNIFLPGSEMQYYVSWRNVKTIDFALYRADLTRDVRFTTERQPSDWLNTINVDGLENVKAWSKETGDTGDYRPGQATWRLEEKLKPGAYVITATAGGVKSRDLLLVSDAVVVTKTVNKRLLAYACDALSGAPIPHARISVWAGWYVGDNKYDWRQITKEAGDDGLCLIDLSDKAEGEQLFVAAASGDRQAYTQNDYTSQPSTSAGWRIYAFTDRPAYRPGEQVQWKFIARTYTDGVYSTPAGKTIQYQIFDPRGTKVKEDTVTLNAFGSIWGTLDVTDKMPLGAYQVIFNDPAQNPSQIGSAALFRLEEYKLPEFKVSVHTPEVDGKRKAFKLGDKVEVTVQADYYFGGPVANATAEVLVYQKPYYYYWAPRRDYPWYYDDMMQNPYRYYGESVVKRETLKTDATGKATLTFDTPQSGNPLEYRIEARVTDASRREIVGGDSVRVSQRLYMVTATPEHNLYRPQDKVTVDFKAQDANEQPQQVEGTVTVTRNAWHEVWLDNNNKEVIPAAGRRLPDGWRIKKRGYENEPILTRALKTDANGDAELTFTPDRDGYYQVSWYSEDRDGDPVEANTTVWVATNASSDIGFRTGGLQIIVDKDTFRAGQTAPVLLSAYTNDRYVLFSIEGDDLYSYQVVHLDGPVKLVQVPITEQHVPNIFLNAMMVSDRQVYQDSKQVVVPPVKQFLDVQLKANKEQYLPREEGTLTVTARNSDGKPVETEVALGLTDEAVYYIQQDLAGDPRQFYYGTKRGDAVRLQSTMNWKRYTQLVENDGQLVDIYDLQRNRDLQVAQPAPGMSTSVIGGTAGDYYGSGYAVAESAAAPAGAAGPMGAVGTPRLALRAMDKDASTVDERAASAKGSGGGAPNGPAVTVRSDFRSTVFWGPDVKTDKDGVATVKVKFPDSLTGWKATARLATTGNQFGIADTTVRTKQPLIVRLQAPRFFVVGDKVTISGVINNNTDQEMTVTPILTTGMQVNGVVTDGKVTPLVISEAGVCKAPVLKVPANGETRVDWQVEATKAGDVKLQVIADGGQFNDAMEKTYTVYEHGVEKFVAKSGKVRGKDVRITLDLPERKKDSTELTVQVAPSLATTMLDALPYLINYPYGCTEQTMSRFMPTVVVARTLQDLGIKREDVAGKLFGGIEAEYADKTHPDGKQDLAKMDEMITQGLQRLYDLQHGDGGWGWWKDDSSDHYMTAYVVNGLALAKGAGVAVQPDALNRGAEYLRLHLVEEETHPDMQSWMLYAMATYRNANNGDVQISDEEKKAFDNLWNNRDHLNAYSRAMFALAAQYYGRTEQAKTLARNLVNGVAVDKTPDTSVVMEGAQESLASVIAISHWGADHNYWRWSDGGIESTAFALRALLAIDPKNPLVESSMNWLVKNRRGAQWTNTRDTSFAVLALSDYLRATGELAPDSEYEVLVNGQQVGHQKVTAKEALNAPSRFAVDRKLLKDGKNEIRIRRLDKGDGPLYFSAQASFVSLEEPVTPAGNEIFVRRAYYKSVGRPTLLKGVVYDQQPLLDNGTVTSGDRVDVILTIEVKNDYDYLLFEDLKPAGLEAVALQSGENMYARELRADAVDRTFVNGKTDREAKDYTGRTAWTYQELRDRKVALFIDHLPQGVWEIRYQLRAETPGAFHALPVLGQAMYVPEIRCNGSEIRMTVEDRK